jgi:hypothetical protein
MFEHFSFPLKPCEGPFRLSEEDQLWKVFLTLLRQAWRFAIQPLLLTQFSTRKFHVEQLFKKRTAALERKHEE